MAQPGVQYILVVSLSLQFIVIKHFHFSSTWKVVVSLLHAAQYFVTRRISLILKNHLHIQHIVCSLFSRLIFPTYCSFAQKLQDGISVHSTSWGNERVGDNITTKNTPALIMLTRTWVNMQISTIHKVFLEKCNLHLCLEVKCQGWWNWSVAAGCGGV